MSHKNIIYIIVLIISIFYLGFLCEYILEKISILEYEYSIILEKVENLRIKNIEYKVRLKNSQKLENLNISNKFSFFKQSNNLYLVKNNSNFRYNEGFQNLN